jgi:hypothetical protein
MSITSNACRHCLCAMLDLAFLPCSMLHLLQADRATVHTPNVCSTLRRLISASSPPSCPTTLLVASILASAHADPGDGEGATRADLPDERIQEHIQEEMQEDGWEGSSSWRGVWGLCWLRPEALDEDLRLEMDTVGAHTSPLFTARTPWHAQPLDRRR